MNHHPKPYGLIITALVCIGFMIAELINDRFWLSDFMVYYTAAERMVDGINLYRHAEDLHYVFKYSPVSALYFIPFIFLPPLAAKIIYWLALTSGIVWSFSYTSRFAPASANHEKQRQNIILIATILFAVHFLRELHLGQVNHLLMISYLLMLYAYHRGKDWLTALVWSAGLFLKPFGLIFLPYFFLRDSWRTLLYFILFTILIFLLPFIFKPDFNFFIGQYTAWLNELSIELGNKQSLLAPANHTLASILARYTPLYFIADLSLGTAVIRFTAFALLGSVILYIILKKPASQVIRTPLDFSLLILLIPLIAFTSENAFGFCLPAAMVVLLHFQSLMRFEKIITGISLLFIGGNFSELTGKKLSAWLDAHSFVAIGAVLLLCILIRIRQKNIA